MRKVLAALGLLGGLWASNVTATIVSYNVTVAGGDWRITDPTPFGIASEPTFSGTLQVNNAYSDGTALVGFKMVTGSKTWTEKSLASANNASFSFDSVGNLSNFGISFATGISANLYISPSLFLLQEPVSNPPNPTKPVASAICDGCVSFAPAQPPPVTLGGKAYGIFLGDSDATADGATDGVGAI